MIRFTLFIGVVLSAVAFSDAFHSLNDEEIGSRLRSIHGDGALRPVDTKELRKLWEQMKKERAEREREERKRAFTDAKPEAVYDMFEKTQRDLLKKAKDVLKDADEGRKIFPAFAAILTTFVKNLEKGTGDPGTTWKRIKEEADKLKKAGKTKELETFLADEKETMLKMLALAEFGSQFTDYAKLTYKRVDALSDGDKTILKNTNKGDKESLLAGQTKMIEVLDATSVDLIKLYKNQKALKETSPNSLFVDANKDLFLAVPDKLYEPLQRIQTMMKSMDTDKKEDVNDFTMLMLTISTNLNAKAAPKKKD